MYFFWAMGGDGVSYVERKGQKDKNLKLVVF